MTDDLQGRRVAILAADGVEQVELEEPRKAVQQAGAATELLSIQPGQIQAVNNDIHPSIVVSVDKTVSEAEPDDYDALTSQAERSTPIISANMVKPSGSSANSSRAASRSA